MYEVLQATIAVLPALLLLWVATRDVGREFRNACRFRSQVASVAVAMGATIALKVVLALTGFWPFEWQWPGHPAAAGKYFAYLEGRQYIAIGV